MTFLSHIHLNKWLSKFISLHVKYPHTLHSQQEISVWKFTCIQTMTNTALEKASNTVLLCSSVESEEILCKNKPLVE